MPTILLQEVNQLVDLFTTPIHNAIPKNPSNYGLDYKDVSFSSLDGVRLKAWHIPAAGNKLILMTHPMRCSRYGYQVTSQYQDLVPVGFELLNTVKHLHAAGYDVLSMDCRNHGESDDSPDHLCGVDEWQDVVGMMKFVNTKAPYQKMRKGFISHCMGANATIKAMSVAPEMFVDIKMLVAIQPLSIAVALAKVASIIDPEHSQKLFKKAEQQITTKQGVSLDSVSPMPYIKDIKVPTMYVQVRSDVSTDPSDIQSFYDSTQAQKELFWIEGEHHRFYGYSYFGEHPERLLAFATKHMS